MQIGIFAKTFAAQGAVAVLEAARAAGYDVTQFNMACAGLPSMPDDIPQTVAEEVGSAARRAGIGIAAVSGTYNMIHPDLQHRADGLRRLGTIAASARAMGTGLVTLCTGSRDPEDQWRYHRDNGSPGAWRDLKEEMAKAVDLAEQHDVDLGIEPELANVVSSALHARRLIDELKSPRLRVVLDPANLFEIADEQQRREVVAEATGLLGDRIAMAHAKDRDDRGGFVVAGRGVIDFRHFVSCLRANGFDGPFVTHGLTAAEAPAVAAFLKEVCA
jgi:sugar phosphate isomerase/epimerase